MIAFVTGGSGFIGSAIVRALLEEGSDVRALARPRSPLGNLEKEPVQVVRGDLSDEDALAASMEGCDEVYHCAALYRFWAPDPEEFQRTNVEGSANVIRAAVRAGVSRIAYTSSVATVATVPGGLGSEAGTVSVEQAPGHYKRSKILAEQAVLRLAAELGAHVVVTNPSAPVGPRDVKPTPTGRMVLDFLNGRMPAYVDTGLNLVDVDAVGRGHLLAARRGRPGERYILGGENLSLIEILRLLSDVTGLPAPFVRLPHAFAHAAAVVSERLARVTGREPAVTVESTKLARHHMYFDSTKAQAELGFSSPPVVRALTRAVKWFRDEGRVEPGRLDTWEAPYWA